MGEREKSEIDRGYRGRGSDGERVNEGGDRPSCLSFLKWDRLSSLFSPLLTWPQIWKKKTSKWVRRNSGERWKGESERERAVRHTFSSPFLAPLWWLTNTNLETSTRRHRYYISVLWPSPSVHSLCNHKAFIYSSAEIYPVQMCLFTANSNVITVIILNTSILVY